MVKQIQNLTLYIREITRPTIFFIQVLGKEQGAFMMRIVDGRFACYIMNTNRRSHRHLNDVVSIWDVGRFSTIRICNEKCKYHLIGSMVIKNKPTRNKDKKNCLECGMLNLECA